MDTVVEPQVHLWTREEYEKIVAAGLLDNKRVELIEGRVIEMSPMGSAHATAVALVAKALERAFGEGYFARWQMPFNAGSLSEPEPDVAIVRGSVRDYTEAHPTDAALIVEVSESSLAYDRTEKLSLYARAGVPEYWIVNLVDDQLDVYRRPVQDDSQPYGFGYAESLRLAAAALVTPAALPTVAISVSELLP